MAISVTSPANNGFGWIKNATSADASGCETIYAAPAAGTSHYIKSVTISSGAAITITLGAGKTGAGVTTALIGPVTFAANQTMKWDFFGPVGAMKVGAATALTVDAGGAGAINVFVQGYTE